MTKRSGVLAASLLLFVLLAPCRVLADTFWVATDGSNTSGDGSSTDPWATIGYAVSSGIPAEGGHTILVRDGVYNGANYMSRGFDSPVIVRAENANPSSTLARPNVSHWLARVRRYMNPAITVAVNAMNAPRNEPRCT